MGRHSHIVSRCLLLLFSGIVAPSIQSLPLLAQSPDSVHHSRRVVYEVPLFSQLKDSLVRLPHQFIIQHSDSVMCGQQFLRPGVDYILDNRTGTIKLESSAINTLLADSVSSRRLVVSYSFLPFRFQDSYYKRKLVVLADSSGKDSIRISQPRSSFGVDDIFGKGLQKSGSIVRGFTVGTNRDLSLNSGLRMQLAGKLSSDIDVVAALTDESTPIQPEGTTQTLQEFDKVFVEIRGSAFTATMGDFNLDLDGTEFARLSRKLQGAKGEANYRFGFSDGNVVLTGAVPRGKYNTNQFPGIEGVQGPYRLTGKNNEPSIVVIAGTERVYVDGQLMTRGETNDYVIDYSIAEVTFTTKRLITSASRITIDFEYTDRQYNRSLFAAQTSSGFLDNKAKLTLSYFREADDQNSPIDFAISDSARRRLERAGANRDSAWLSGVTRVDSFGTYVLVDTLINSDSVSFYRYAPAKTAPYNIVFSNVGFGRGEYIRQSIGVYVWKGRGAGDYLPRQYLPLPQLQQTIDARLNVNPVSDLSISAEAAMSNFDQNRFSSIDDDKNNGHAFNFTVGFAPKNVRLGGTNIGSFNLQLKERYVNRRFAFIDRVNDIEFNRKWGIDSSTQANEELREATLNYTPIAPIAIGAGYGSNKRGAAFNSTRKQGSLAVKGDGLPLIDYTIENIQSDEAVTDNASSWLRQKGIIEQRFPVVVPSFRYEAENRSIASLSMQTPKQGSFKYDVFAPGLKLRELGPLALGGEIEWRTDNVFNQGSVVRESKSFTQSYNARLSEWNHVASSLDITLRQKKYSETFLLLGNSDIKTILVRSQTKLAPLNRGLESDLFYEVATERTSRLQRVFVHVTQGTGNYRYLGDLNGDGVQNENEFVPARFDGDYIALNLPSDQLFPVIDLKASARVRLTPRLLFEGTPGWLYGAASALTTETYVRIDEKSNEPDLKQIYLLHFSRFQNDSTTITGSTLFTQDLNILEGSPDVSARIRYSQRTGLNRFTSGTERSYTRERSVRLRTQLVREIANQIDLTNRWDRVNGPAFSNRLHDIVSNSLVYDLSYRPEQNLELGFKMELGNSVDRYHAVDSTLLPDLKADLNTQSVRFVYGFQGAGQFRTEASREEVRLNQSRTTFPFELTGGRVEGKTWLWRAAFDYRVTEFIQATMNYDGRSEGGRAPVHTARAEVRAFF